jgi:hypothetical protein
MLRNVGYVNLRLRRDSIAVHLLHLQTKDSEVSNGSDSPNVRSWESINHGEPDLLVDTLSSINFVSELLTCENETDEQCTEESGEFLKKSSKVTFSVPSKSSKSGEYKNSALLDHHLLSLRESTTKG